jgi:nucleoside-diphosphate-sugar epimerase
MRLVVFGATGMTGIEVLHLALADPRITQVTTIGRRVTGVVHPKLRERTHGDMLDLAPVAEPLRTADLIIHCLGVYQNNVPADEFWKVTVGYLDALLAILKQQNADPRFCLMGAQGADPTEKSPFLFAKAKGRAEQHLLESHLTRRHIFRPGYIKPGRLGGSRSTMPEWIAQPLFKLLPFMGIAAVDLARVMLEVGVAGSGQVLFTNADMRRMTNA